MLNIADIFSQIKKVKILLLGDFLLDVYTVGTVERISPEAPVPVLLATDITYSAGGAGNVALNLKSLGADVAILGRIGRDDAGKKIESLMKDASIDINGLIIQETYKTPLKNRFLANGQQLMRSDYEIKAELDSYTEEKIIDYLDDHINEFDVIAVSDYAKGFLSNTVLENLMTISKKAQKKVIVDPKGSDFSKYKGAYLIKPNLQEAYIATGLDKSKDLETVANGLLEITEAENLLITRSEKGMSLFCRGQSGYENFPAQKKDVRDVTGAGDTALSMIAFGIANSMPFDQIIHLANIASSLAIEKVGCVAVSFSDIIKRIFEKHPTTKIFDERANLIPLEKAVEDATVIVIDLKKYSHINQSVYQEIKKAYLEKGDSKILVHLDPGVAEKDFMELLASMHEVDFVFVREKSPYELIELGAFLTRI
jgi:rfaE bifunctional protein kinase chain/domain